MKIQNVVLAAILVTSLFIHATARKSFVEDSEVELSVARMAKVGFALSLCESG